MDLKQINLKQLNLGIDVRQINLGVDVRHASVIKSTMGIINGIKYESDNIINFDSNRYIMSNRAIIVRLPDDDDGEMDLLYSRCTIKVPDEFRKIQGLKSNYIYKNNRKAIINLSTKDIKKLSTLENLDDTSHTRIKWSKIIKGLDKAYTICFQDEQQVDDTIDQFIYEYFKICEKRFKKICYESQKLKNLYIKLFTDKYRYSNNDISELCIPQKEIDENVRFRFMRTAENRYKMSRDIKIYNMNSTTLLCVSNMLEISLELGKGITFEDKQTGDYYSIWVIGKTYNSNNLGRVAKNKKLLCTYTIEVINTLIKKDLSDKEVSIKLKVVNMLNPNIVILKHDKNKIQNSILDIQDYEFYKDLKKVPKEYYDPILIILCRIINRYNRLYENDSFRETHGIYNFGFKNVIESIDAYNKVKDTHNKINEWDINTDSAKILALLLDE